MGMPGIPVVELTGTIPDDGILLAGPQLSQPLAPLSLPWVPPHLPLLG